MQDLSKTKRLLSLAKWLVKAKKAGIARESIIETFGISEKTFLRDIKDLESSMPFIVSRYDRETKRLYGEFCSDVPEEGEKGRQSFSSTSPTAQAQEKAFHAPSFEEYMQMSVGTSIDQTDLKKTYHYHFREKSAILMSKTEFEDLLHAILNEIAIGFFTTTKNAMGCPYFFTTMENIGIYLSSVLLKRSIRSLSIVRI